MKRKFYSRLLFSGLLIFCGFHLNAQTVTLLDDINSGTSGSSPGNLTKLGTNIIFSANDGTNGTELWKSDGTSGGTVLVKDIRPGSANSSPGNFVVMGSYVYFTANDGTNGIELWRTDGTANNTTMVKNINPGSANSAITELTAIDNKLYFRADDGTNGKEPWVSDGTSAGTFMLKNIAANNWSSSSNGNKDPQTQANEYCTACFGTFEFVKFGSYVYFNANDQNGLANQNSELWRTDGTSVNTALFYDNYSGGGGGPSNLANAGSYLYFYAYDGGGGYYEPYATNGTTTQRLKNINIFSSASGGESPTAVMNGVVYFLAGAGNDNGATINIELWRTDGTSDGTYLLKDINTTPSSSFSVPGNSDIINFYVYNNKLYFSANDGTNGQEPWVSDGTAAGTVMLKNINTSGNSGPSGFEAFNGYVYFSADDNSTYGRELWRTDGTAAGTTLVSDINSGGVDGSPSQFAPLSASKMLFRATTAATGSELFQLGGAASPTISTSAISGSPWCNAGATNVNVPFTVTGTFTGGNVFTAVLSNSSGNFSSGTTNIGTLTSTGAGTISAVIPSGLTAGTGYRIRVTANNPSTTGTDNGANLTIVAASVGGSVSSAQSICTGTSPADLTLAGNTGSVTKWQKSSDAAFTSPVDINSTSTTLTSANIGTLTADTWFRAVVQNGVCAATNSASVKITIVAASVGGSVSSDQTICTGTSPANLALAGNTGSVTKWQKAGNSSFTGATDINITSTTLTSANIGNLTADTWFRAVVQNGVCAATNSASVKITIVAASVGGSVSSIQTICTGTSPADLTLAGNTGSVTKWQKSSDAAFTSPVDINSTSTTLTSANIGTLTADTWFRAVVQNGVCAATNSATAKITVNATSVGGSVSSAQSICTGTSPADLTLSGNTGSVTKWQKSSDAAFTSPIDINITSTTLTSANIGTLTADAWFRAVVQNGVCAATNSATVKITVNATSVGGNVSSAQTICAGFAPADLILSGNTGSVTKWQKSSDAAFTSPVDINSTSTTLTSANIGTLTADTWFRAVVQNGVCAATNSATVKITVNANPIVSAPAVVCVGSIIHLSPASGGTWVSNDPSKATVTNDGTVTGVAAGSVTFTFTATATGCSSTTTGVTVNALPVLFTLTGGGSYCLGGSGLPVGLSDSEPGISYQLLRDGNTAGTAVAGSGEAITFGSQTVAGTYTVRATNTATNCTIIMTGSAVIGIYSIPTATISGTNTVCQSSTPPPVTFTGSNGTAPYTFTYQINAGGALTTATVSGNSVDVAASTTTATTLTYTLLSVQDSHNCSQNQSGSAVITVSPLPNATITYPGSPFKNIGTAAVSLTGTPGGTFSATGGLVISASTGQIDLANSPTGTYTVTYTIAPAGGCAQFQTTALVIIGVKVLYVNAANVNPTQDGATWAKAFANLKSALSAAASSTSDTVEVWVAQGTYKPGALRRDVFEIPSGVRLYGGFTGGETDVNARNWKTNLTVLSGEIGTPALNDNSQHVVLFRATNSLTRLDGFRIEKGYAEFYAGNQNSDLNDPNLLSSGGGVLAIDKSRGLITNCVLTDNRATSGGAMMLMDSSTLKMTQTVVWGNEANFGGGIYVIGGSKPILENVLVVSNKGLGGGLYVNQSQLTLSHCTVASNQGNGSAGGIFNINSITTVKNSILWGNTSPQSTVESVISYSIVEGGYPGAGNQSLNPLFVDPNSVGLAPLGSLGDYHLQACSPAINAGDNNNAPMIDLDGNARPFPAGLGIVDMGVYESQSTDSSGPNHVNITEAITSGTVLKVGGFISATNQVSNATVVYQATHSVTLSPGFSATGNTFQALIGGCGTN